MQLGQFCGDGRRRRAAGVARRDWYVTAHVNSSGTEVERYEYTPYGTFAVYDPTWTSRASGSHGWVYQPRGLPNGGVPGTYQNRGRAVRLKLGLPTGGE